MSASTLSADAHLRTILDQLPVAAYVCDPEGVISFCNPPALGLWGRAPGLHDPAERYCGALRRFTPTGTPLPSADSPVARALRENTIIAGEELLLERPDGTRVAVRAHAAPVQDEAGGILGAMGLLVEVSSPAAAADATRLASLLRTGASFERLGLLAGRITHELNNLLTPIVANTGLAQARTDDPQLQHMLAEIGTAARHAGNVTQQLLALATQRCFERRPIDVGATLTDMRALFDVTLARRSRLTLETSAAMIDGDAGQLRQMVVDLLANSADALPESGGSVAVRVSVRQVPAGQLRSAADGQPLPAGAYVRIEVEDDGHGMTPEVRERLFEPFFTTRDHRRGLGLVAVRNVVTAHQGAIEITSTPGHGTLVQVWFALRGAEAGRGSAAPAAVSPAPLGRVLVVDDDELIRRVCLRALQHARFAVTAAASGRDGLAAFQRERGTWSAILLDLTMPDLNGEMVIRWIRELDTSVPVLLTSGHLESAASREFRRMGANGFIGKPFSAVELVQAVVRIASVPTPAR